MERSESGVVVENTHQSLCLRGAKTLVLTTEAQFPATPYQRHAKRHLSWPADWARNCVGGCTIRQDEHITVSVNTSDCPRRAVAAVAFSTLEGVRLGCHR